MTTPPPEDRHYREAAEKWMRQLEEQTEAQEGELAKALPESSFREKVWHSLLDWISKVDTQVAQTRVESLRQEHPEAEAAELCELLIRAKCQRTGTVGAVTSATSAIPVIGSVFSMTLGLVVDLGSTITAQAELVLEIAEVYQVPLTENNKRETVLLILGLGSGLERLGQLAGQQLGQAVSQKLAKRWVAKAIPVLGVAASAGTNALSTYVIGRRAQAYFAQGPEALGDWQESLRAISGVDERKIGHWLQSRSQQALEGVQQSSRALIENTTRGVIDGAKSVSSGVQTGAQKLAQGTQDAAEAVGDKVSLFSQNVHKQAKKLLPWEKKQNPERDGESPPADTSLPLEDSDSPSSETAEESSCSTDSEKNAESARATNEKPNRENKNESDA